MTSSTWLSLPHAESTRPVPIWNLGSINADTVFQVPHLPQPGETLAALSREQFLGGKGTNMSVAAARAAARVHHIGAVGPDGKWALDRLMEYGVDVTHVAQIDTETGQAIIAVDPQGENLIILHAGANFRISVDAVQSALTSATTGDWLLMQNETNAQVEAAQLAKQMGLKVAYASAPFDSDAVSAVLKDLDLLFLNAVEAEQLRQSTGLSLSDLPVPDVIVTKGADGADWHGPDGKVQVAAHRVRAIDTTGAGDTFTGYVLASLDRGLDMQIALSLASKASAIMVTRQGTADVIPDLKDVQEFEG